ncbi:DUF4180 domain-containing protein [Fulvivirgaceae bacterium PWU4]|uniref:DUF4180 domain-containing protein n=1 Tax=Chryseosolibacter histidini TaxID=2782349 RepID=A0AAP2DQT4_9BACT|nr:DUF4180 domain-containing protein [Chryseosolibacter histidini]MBT1699643.1 DUF4180 domain-containing protein [Chryseosolibacter histidini]
MITDHTIHNIADLQIAEITTTDLTIGNAQLFLEIIMNLPVDRIVIRKENLDESFFDLRTGLAGEILQKVVNYRMRLAIVGDYSAYTSKSLKDFIYESNKSNTVVFVGTIDEALKRMSD